MRLLLYKCAMALRRHKLPRLINQGENLEPSVAREADGSAVAGNINSIPAITAAKELLILQPCLTIRFLIF